MGRSKYESVGLDIELWSLCMIPFDMGLSKRQCLQFATIALMHLHDIVGVYNVNKSSCLRVVLYFLIFVA